MLTLILSKTAQQQSSSVQKLEKNYFKVIDALMITLIKDNDDLLGTVNSYIKYNGPPLKRCKTKAADSRYAKLKKTRDEEELAKAKKEKEEKEA
ncbi:hypothetical protein HBH71_240080 [Parastagonospora nodorum]|nr:hypothetical protein HBH71_240080 [Parastagonospora nodorum]